MTHRVVSHPSLGQIRWDESLGCWSARVEIAPDHSIDLSIVVEDHWLAVDPLSLFDLAAKFLIWAQAAERICRDRIADEMLVNYNTVWADDDPEEGPPPLDRDGFVARLRLRSISFSPTGDAEWFYSDGDLFAGHGVSISSNAGREFSGSMLFG